MKPFFPDRDTLERFAELLEYPCGTGADVASRGAEALSIELPEAADLLRKVRTFFSDSPRERAEEIFTATFDLQAVCAPYVGFHLFGEGHKRRVFLAGMNSLYSSRGFSAGGGELPDHITVVLRYLADSAGEGQAREIVEDGLIPALSKMLGKFEDGGNPYGNVLRALQSVLLPVQRTEEMEAPQGRPETEVGTP